MGKKAPQGSGPAGDRAARVAAMRKEQAKKENKRKAVTGVAMAVALSLGAGLIAIAALKGGNDDPVDGEGELAGATITKDLGQKHVAEEVKYDQTPPVGGDHDQAWANCKVYEAPIRNENGVHSLEHGAVWITYKPDLAADDVKKLKDKIPSTYAIMSPYPDLPAPVVASAWGRQMQMTGVDDPRIEQFIRTYRQGPQTLEPGAACTGGVDGTSKPGEAL
ncbi:MAG: DUF3105 domain-containing protein [Sporichthyaceae bacterium]